MGFVRPFGIHAKQVVHPEPKDRGLQEAETERLSSRGGAWHHELGKVIEDRVARRRGLVPGRCP